MKWRMVIVLLAIAGNATSQEIPGSEYIIVPKKTQSLSIKNAYLREDGVPAVVEMEGTISARATVSYGWFEDGGTGSDGSLMVHLLFSSSEWSKMPHYDYWKFAQCNSDSGCEFHLDNDDEFVETLFDKKTQSLIRSRRLMQVRKSADLTLTDISFGNDCGAHYSAKAYVRSASKNSMQVAMNAGFPAHC